MLPGLNGPNLPKVAFFAGLKDNKGPVSENTDLIFDSVITNVGAAFDMDTGRFTAPYNGTFQFTVVVAAQGRQRVRFFDERMERICLVFSLARPFVFFSPKLYTYNNTSIFIYIVFLSITMHIKDSKVKAVLLYTTLSYMGVVLTG